MSRLLRSDRGQAGIALIIVIAWALTAVFMLTRTLVAATQINTRVKDITGSVSGIKGETALVQVLTETNRIAADILTAAQPLAPKLEEVDASAKSINRTVADILANARSIGATVDGINANAKSILSTAREINDGVAAINRKVITAAPIVNAIKADTGAIREDVRSGDGIHGHVCRIPLSGPDQHC